MAARFSEVGDVSERHYDGVSHHRRDVGDTTGVVVVSAVVVRLEGCAQELQPRDDRSPVITLVELLEVPSH